MIYGSLFLKLEEQWNRNVLRNDPASFNKLVVEVKVRLGARLF